MRRSFSSFWRGTDFIFLAGLTALVLVAMAALFAPVLPLADPNEQDLRNQFAPPSDDHWLGTDDLGRDTLSRLVWGSRVSLRVGLLSVAMAVAVGAPLGVISGYRGNATDTIVMRTMDALLSFPPILLTIAVVAALGPGIQNATIALAVVFVPSYARLARGAVLVVKQLDYSAAARAIGASPSRLVVRHIVPNSIAPVAVQASLGIGIAIIAEASLAYLGLGSQPPNPSWGSMLREATPFLDRTWRLSVLPGLCIMIVVLAVNIVGDKARDAFDPRLRNLA